MVLMRTSLPQDAPPARAGARGAVVAPRLAAVPDRRPLPRTRRIARSAVGRRLADQPLRNLGVLGAGLVLASTAAFGGLEPAETAGMADFAFGDTVRAAPLAVTVDRVTWVDGPLPGVYLTDDANRWIGVVATVATDHTESLADEPSHTVALAGVEGLVAEPVDGTDAVRSTDQVLMADGSRLSPMQPGLSYEVVFLFEQEGDAAPPETVEIVLLGHTWRADSFDGTFGWKDAAPVARATVPARAGVDATAEDGDGA